MAPVIASPKEYANIFQILHITLPLAIAFGA